MDYLNNIGKNAKEASRLYGKFTSKQKNTLLNACAEAILSNNEYILTENKKDIEKAKEAGMKLSLVDRLSLTEQRIEAMAEGLCQLAMMDDPVGEILYMKKMTNGLTIGQKRVPMGVIGVIYESRPNVTIDAFGICAKAGSAVILRGGKEAVNSNIALVKVVQDCLTGLDFPKHLVQLIDDVSRETTIEFMKLKAYVDVLIPRGSNSLIQSVVENSNIPVIETGVGNCHIFVDETADLDNAMEIVVNAKTQRPGTCNTCEKLLVHRNIAEKFLPAVCGALMKHNVEIRGDEATCGIIGDSVVEATESDWPTEYLDYIIAIKVVDNIDEALEHIEKYSSKHSEAILTESYKNSKQFLDQVDSAAVYVNASTRFTDGFEFGFGAEIGISTQKLHARGPMGVKELTTTKFIIYGDGQIRK